MTFDPLPRVLLDTHSRFRGHPMSSPQPTAIDPVCGMTVPVGVITRDFEGATYHFCSALCASRFEHDAIAFVTVARLGLDGWGETPAPGFLTRGQD